MRSHKLKRRGKTLNILGSSRTPHLESIAAIKQGMGDGQQAISVPAVSASPSSDNEISGAGSATTPEITVRVAPPKGAVGSAQILSEQPVTKSENGMPFHPLANIFPMVGEAELRDLADDVRHRGLLEPITVLDGQVLDGRSRYLACEMAGVKPTFVEFDRGDAVGFVVGKNVRRRHLTESQRALVAARLADMNVGANQHSAGLPIGRAAKLVNVGERSVARAKEVLRHAEPELVRAVERGEISVSVAAKKCRSLQATPRQPAAEHQDEPETHVSEPTNGDVVETSKDRQAPSTTAEIADGARTVDPTSTPPITLDEDAFDLQVNATAHQTIKADDQIAFEALQTAWVSASTAVKRRFVVEIVQVEMRIRLGT